MRFSIKFGFQDSWLDSKDFCLGSEYHVNVNIRRNPKFTIIFIYIVIYDSRNVEIPSKILGFQVSFIQIRTAINKILNLVRPLGCSQPYYASLLGNKRVWSAIELGNNMTLSFIIISVITKIFNIVILPAQYRKRQKLKFCSLLGSIQM